MWIKDGCRLLNDNKNILEHKLREEKILAGEIYFAVGENLDMTEFSLKESHNRKSKRFTDALQGS